MVSTSFTIRKVLVRPWFSNLCYHKFRCNFQDWLNTLQLWTKRRMFHLTFHCPSFVAMRTVFLGGKIEEINSNLSEMTESCLTQTLLLVTLSLINKQTHLLDARHQSDIVVWNHSRLSVRLSVRLFICPSASPSVYPSITKFSQHWIIGFFWYFTWW